MKKIKAAAVILLCAVLLPTMISCSKLSFLRREKPKSAKYVNSDYHFSLVYPSSFENIKEIPSTENKDEYRIEFRDGDDKLIYVDITYKKAADLFEYAELSRFEKDKIKPLSMTEFDRSVNSFSYDSRSCPSNQKPAYYIFASTKRMLYTVCYEFERGDEDADEICDMLSFEFDIYANVPKENQFLSSPYKINLTTSSVCIPADYGVSFYPAQDTVPVISRDEETGEVIYPDYSQYKTVEASSKCGYLYLTFPDEIEHSIPQIVEDSIDDTIKPYVKEMCKDKISSVSFADAGNYKVENNITYRKIYFTCYYNQRACSGTLTVGFTGGFRYFKSVYLIADDASAAERQCYDDMIHSMKLN